MEISEVCHFGNGVKPISSSAVVVGNTVYVTIVQIGVGFG